MKKHATGLALMLVCADVNAATEIFQWRFESFTDEIAGITVHEAKIIDGWRQISFQCRISQTGRKQYLLGFKTKEPVAVYDAKVDLAIKLENVFTLTYAAQMYANSMTDGYVVFSEEDFLPLSGLFAYGQSVQFRVTPKPVGEFQGGTLSLSGSADAIEKMTSACQQ